MSVLLIGLAASIFFMPELAVGDLLYVYVYALVLVLATIPAFKDVVMVMMEGTPKHINVANISKDDTITHNSLATQGLAFCLD